MAEIAELCHTSWPSACSGCDEGKGGLAQIDGPAIVRIRMADAEVEMIADLKNLRRSFGIFAFWRGLTPDNSPLLVRDTGTQEIYALDWDAR